MWRGTLFASEAIHNLYLFPPRVVLTNNNSITNTFLIPQICQLQWTLDWFLFIWYNGILHLENMMEVFAFFIMADGKVNNPVVLIQTEEMNKSHVTLKVERGWHKYRTTILDLACEVQSLVNLLQLYLSL